MFSDLTVSRRLKNGFGGEIIVECDGGSLSFCVDCMGSGGRQVVLGCDVA